MFNITYSKKKNIKKLERINEGFKHPSLFLNNIYIYFFFNQKWVITDSLVQ